jgi:hypothetical protein
LAVWESWRKCGKSELWEGEDMASNEPVGVSYKGGKWIDVSGELVKGRKHLMELPHAHVQSWGH